MWGFAKHLKIAGQVLALGLFVTVGFGGCNHLDKGAITVNCGSGSEDDTSNGHGACDKKAPHGEQVNGITCTGGLVCSGNGAICSRSGGSKRCKNVMPSGGTLCDCACLP
jgi:hypothetical protein